MFNDIIDNPTEPWKRNGSGEWYYNSNIHIRLYKKTDLIYFLYYSANDIRVIVGRTDDEAKDKAEDFLKMKYKI